VWTVTPADDDVRRDGIGLDTDDRSWPTIEVPGHWRLTPGFGHHDGPLLHRRRFELAPPEEGRRRWITFDGIFYQADVWLDGAYLGDPEGYFVPHAFDVTALSRLGDEHVLAVEVACPPLHSHRGRRNITGVFQHWDGLPLDWNPGGIWRDVRVVDTGPVRIDRLRVLCRDADEARAHLLLHTRLDSDTGRTVRVRTRIDGRPVAESEHVLAAGANDVEWRLDVDRPALWWPRALGDQPLTTVEVDVVVEGVTSDLATRRTGLRQVAWNDWICSVNGERLFLKGANLLPTRAGLAAATPEEVRRDVELAAEIGLDVLRVHGHIARPEVYDAADELGILLLQDFPLQWGYARSVRPRAVEQARAAVDLLGHHPSIASWTAHNDPAAVAVGLEGDTPRRRLAYLAAHQLPSWNKSVLDRWVKRAFETADPTRPCVPHSGVLPHLPRLDGTDSHFYFGWYHGSVDDLPRLARRLPRLVRFLSEFGAQSVPEHADFLDPAAWPDLDWERLARDHGLQKWVFDLRVPPAEHPTFESWRHATQTYQAELVRRHVETLRLLKYRPTGGFCVFAWNDPAPMVSWSLLDHERAPKPAFRALARACEPVLVVIEQPPAAVTVGDRLRLRVHVVNDLRTALDDAVIDVTATWPGGRRAWRFSGSIGADEVARVGRLDLRVPDTLGVLRIDARLTAGDRVVDRHVTTAVTVAPG
jgi:beta-mannosidase